MKYYVIFGSAAVKGWQMSGITAKIIKTLEPRAIFKDRVHEACAISWATTPAELAANSQFQARETINRRQRSYTAIGKPDRCARAFPTQGINSPYALSASRPARVWARVFVRHPSRMVLPTSTCAHRLLRKVYKLSVPLAIANHAAACSYGRFTCPY